MRELVLPIPYGAIALGLLLVVVTVLAPGTPGGLLTMLAEWGKLPLSEVLAPAIELADGYPVETELVGVIARERERLAAWPFSRAVFLPRAGEPPEQGELFRQPDLARTLRRLVEAERERGVPAPSPS